MDTTASPWSPPPIAPRRPREPYCSNCGYSLTGATDSSRCPECGLPLVEVLTRAPFTYSRSRRFRSEATIFGLPIVDIAIGPDLDKGEHRGKARGLIAIGDTAQGGIAIGGAAFGVVAIGGMAVGGFTIGGFSIGALAAVGGGAVGLGFSCGGGAVGSLAAGGGAAGLVAMGGGAVGIYAQGGGATGRYTISPRRADPEAKAMFQTLSWFFGPPRPVPSPLAPLGATLGATLAAALAIAALAAIGQARHAARRRELPGAARRP
jgi:hypothetical protein